MGNTKDTKVHLISKEKIYVSLLGCKQIIHFVLELNTVLGGISFGGLHNLIRGLNLFFYLRRFDILGPPETHMLPRKQEFSVAALLVGFEV